jgi:hypothetical protein
MKRMQGRRHTSCIEEMSTNAQSRVHAHHVFIFETMKISHFNLLPVGLSKGKVDSSPPLHVVLLEKSSLGELRRLAAVIFTAML